MNKNIDWRKLETASGYAVHIPDAISRLNSDSESERKNAYREIDNFVVLQGNLYESAYYVIEPLVELLEQGYTVDRIWPLTALTEIVFGFATEMMIMPGGGTVKTIRDACQDKFRELRDRIGKIATKTPKEKLEKTVLLDMIDYGEVR